MQPLLLLMAFLLAPKAQAVKIIGGHEVKPHSRPYMAFLRIEIPDRKRCGGFLVREDFVLTAAHCWGRSITVILGAHNIREPERTQQVIPVKTAIRHPNYHPKVNDIMLLQGYDCPGVLGPSSMRIPVLCLQLQRKATLTAAVSLLRLPRRGEQVKPGMVCRVAGWGRLDLNTSTATLHEVELEIQEDKQYAVYNRATEICVGDPGKSQSTFKGDSGGPLVCDNTAQGIVSFGGKNGKPPRVETKISSFLPWIKRTMRRTTDTASHPPSSLNLQRGHEAKPHSSSYMAYIHIQDEETRCGQSVSPGGPHHLEAGEDPAGHPGEKSHPTNYNPRSFSKDIMLLQLERNIRLSNAVKPLHCPGARAGEARTDGHCGWLRAHGDGTLPTTLQQVELAFQKN
ncbi:hypothetical protein QTO34_019392 [Cnephaeus nilssonii]|uniref:Peptidase S1 domain-containing protein n=1 Tax=Cnephaeus nilssonii TaxID=3371016 RepID=A0AA40HWN3_CNENI|nr:hypothetical protein QTO34_019392 [Eptesicus nilssonii]